uniref:Copine C-terminal domain-containing protein n=1 Tax=Oryza sativa subsp. japonica TaxID=39947 RepID=Q69R45_ORYSJ|nr:hypothetical protein [Oryza sativa Japonica Group]
MRRRSAPPPRRAGAASTAPACFLAQGGAMTDLQETIDTIIKASDFPSSILVAGVGGADGNGDNGTGKLLAII